MKKYILFPLIATAMMVLTTACSFDRFPQGSSILQQQYEKLSNTLEGSLRGIYALLYTEVDDHDWFAQRSIDMYQDIMCGDMALTASNYGWFQRDEIGLTSSYRTGTIWSYYYRMLHNTNAVLGLVEVQAPELLRKINEKGLETDTIYTEAEIEVAYYYAQALTMRGWIYSNLVRFYVPETSDLNSKLGRTLGDWDALPVYTQANMNEPQKLSTAAQVYSQIEQDLTLAVELFHAFADQSAFQRTSKLEVNEDIACAMLAYSYLNKGASADDYKKALGYSKQAIDNHNFSILPYSQLTSNGFNDVNSQNWMWGRHTTTETVSGLPSFWGQVDIHCYSYAWIGDTKACDSRLFDSIPAFDARRNWFNDGKANPVYKLCPDGKFFSKSNPTSTKSDKLDREWLNDDVYMRYEVLYLIASEACYRLGDYATSIDYLTQLMDERVNPDSAGDMAAYASYKTSLASNPNILKNAITMNWRIEMWGEGYGWQTFRRLTKAVTLGGNHDKTSSRNEIKSQDAQYMYFSIPSNEETYNPNFDLKD